MKNETPLIPGWYINFQTAVLKQLPRPDEIDQITALGWEQNQKSLKKTLAESLIPPKIITRVVKVNRNRSAREATSATGRTIYASGGVEGDMPNGVEEEVKLEFFKPHPESFDNNGRINDDVLLKEYDFLGLEPADPYSLCDFNAKNPSFADDYPHITHWKDNNGKWCYVAFPQWVGGRVMYLLQRDDDCRDDCWWFVGIRK